MIKQGQIWAEVDPRLERHVRVESIGVNQISIRTVIRTGDGWMPARGSRCSYANRERFNGKRGGYELIAQGDMSIAAAKRQN